MRVTSGLLLSAADVFRCVTDPLCRDVVCGPWDCTGRLDQSCLIVFPRLVPSIRWVIHLIHQNFVWNLSKNFILLCMTGREGG